MSGSIVEVGWKRLEAGSRLKEVGKEVAVVRLKEGGREETDIEIEVVRLQS